jgi:ribosomal protein S18 acetylase RimI-like enzyme
MADDPPFRRSDYLLGAAAGAELALRRITQADADILGPAITSMEPWARLELSAEQMIGFLAGSNENLRCFSIWRGGDRAGVAVVRFPWLSGPYLNLLAVLPAFQHNGLGRAALSWMEAEALGAGARSCFLCVSAFNTAAHAFYRWNGYADAATLHDLIKDGEDEVLMRKRLR